MVSAPTENSDNIIDLFALTLGSDSARAVTAADELHKIIAAMPVNLLTRLEVNLRKRSAYSSQSIYEWYNVKSLRSLEQFGDASTSLLGIASFHPNGYIREDAIKSLSTITTGAELPYLLSRLNDWVSEVRVAARTAVHARLKPAYCLAFLANHGLLTRLGYAGRTDQKDTLQAVHDLLASAECRADLLQALTSTDRFIRRWSFKIAFSLPDTDLQHVAELALAETDTVVRSWAAAAISSAADKTTLEFFLARMKHDRFMPVRRAALRMMVKLHSPDLNDALRAALLDPHASIREEARYHLKKLHPIDLAAFYRQQLSDAQEPALYAAIRGLGENGRTADAQFVVRYTAHQLRRIRLAALKTVAALHPDPYIDIFMKALADETRSISRQAWKTLSAKTSLLNVARVWDVFQATTHIHVKRNALALIGKFSKWESIAYLVRARCETDEDLIRVSRNALDVWLGDFNRSYSVPSAEQVANLEKALDTCGEFIDEDTQQRLRFSLRSL